MDETANQGQYEENDIILPDDFVETATSQADTNVTNQTENTNSNEVTTQQIDYSPFLSTLSEKIKYNHEPVKVESIDDVVANYQKGMNYDKLQEKLNTIQNDPRISKYDKVMQIANAYGMSDDQLFEELFNQYYENVAQNQGLTPEQVKKEYEINQRESTLNQKEQNLTQKQQTDQMYERFLQRFPDIKETDIKPETWVKVKNGMDLTAAFIEQRNQELEIRMKVLEQNEKNTKTAPVNGATVHGSTQMTSSDPFLEGFDSI